MPTIQESLTSNIKGWGKMPAAVQEPPSLPVSGSLDTTVSIKRSPTLRCPVPQIGVVSADTLRQWYLPSIGQNRVVV